MDQMAIENCSIVSAKESLPEFGINDRQAGFLPSLILPEIYRTKSGKVVYPAYTQEERALHRVLDRLAGWNLPGKVLEDPIGRLLVDVVIHRHSSRINWYRASWTREPRMKVSVSIVTVWVFLI
jgi:hypothetical protein